MSWTYDVTQLSTSQLMQIRFEIGDTDSADPLMQDEEINYAIGAESSVASAAAKCCEGIARKFARLADTTLGPSKVAASQRFDHYQALAKQLRKDTTAMNAPTGGGMYVTDLPDPNIIPPIFDKDLMSPIKENSSNLVETEDNGLME